MYNEDILKTDQTKIEEKVKIGIDSLRKELSNNNIWQLLMGVPVV